MRAVIGDQGYLKRPFHFGFAGYEFTTRMWACFRKLYMTPKIKITFHEEIAQRRSGVPEKAFDLGPFGFAGYEFTTRGPLFQMVEQKENIFSFFFLLPD